MAPRSRPRGHHGRQRPATQWHDLAAATPAVAVHPPGPLATNDLDIYNPLFAGQLAWDLGNGFNFSYLLGVF